LEAHLVRWTREVADLRVHGTTGEAPLERFVRAEAQALQPLEAKPSFLAERELVRIVHSDCCVEVEANWYSAPQDVDPSAGERAGARPTGADPPWRPDRR
jgi:hypothetical protein